MNPLIQDLLGQTETLSHLVDAAVSGRLHHCLILEGPPQVGKFTAAMRLAMASACLAPGPDRPCGACANCHLIQQGNHPDVIVVTPDPKRKSRTISVDQARELIRQVRLHRYSARWRTVIIDPVDGLMPQAANALLKTFEEPPPGTGFLLVTSRVSGLLPTVRSRSQRVRFRAVPEAQLVPWLAHRGVSSPERVARLAMGCPGRALQLAAGGLQKTDAVRDRLVDALAGGSPAIFEYAENLTRKGETREELDMALDALEGLLRDAAVWAGGRHDASLNADRPDLVQAWGRALWPGGFERLQRVLDEARVRASLNVNGRLILESMLAQVVQELGPARRPPRPS